MLFFTFSNRNIQFAWKKLTWLLYTIAKALLITKWVKIINKKEFTKAMLDKNVENFVIYITFLSMIVIYLATKTQITLLVTKKV